MRSFANRVFFFQLSSHGCVRVVAAAILLIAAVLKGATVSPLRGVGWSSQSTSDLLQLLLVTLELFAAVWFLIGLNPRHTRVAGILLFVIFAGFSAFHVVQGDATCGCFGAKNVEPAWTLILDLSVAAGFVAFRPKVEHKSHSLRRRQGAILVCVVVATSGTLMLLVLSPAQVVLRPDYEMQERGIALQPETWLGKELPLAQYIDIGAELMQSEWIVVLFHQSCNDCREALPFYEAMAEKLCEQHATRRIALIEVSSFGMEERPASAYCRVGRLTPQHDWFVSTPAEIELVDGLVVRIALSDEVMSTIRRGIASFEFEPFPTESLQAAADRQESTKQLRLRIRE
jgi:hypothetical protein